MGLDQRVLSSLTGLVLCSRHNPAINRWAIFERPCGTWNRDTLNTYKAQKTTLTQSLRDCYIGSVISVCRNTCQPAAHIATVFVGDGIERNAPALGEHRPPLFFRNTAIVRRADGRKRRCEQPPTSSAAARQLPRSKMIAFVIGAWRWTAKTCRMMASPKEG